MPWDVKVSLCLSIGHEVKKGISAMVSSLTVHYVQPVSEFQVESSQLITTLLKKLLAKITKTYEIPIHFCDIKKLSVLMLF
jgi:hypothetical protein